MDCYTCHNKVDDNNCTYFGYPANRIYICAECWKENLGNLKFYCDHSHIEDLTDHCCMVGCRESVSYIDIFVEHPAKTFFSRRQIFVCRKCYDHHIGIDFVGPEIERVADEDLDY